VRGLTKAEADRSQRSGFRLMQGMVAGTAVEQKIAVRKNGSGRELRRRNNTRNEAVGWRTTSRKNERRQGCASRDGTIQQGRESDWRKRAAVARQAGIGSVETNFPTPRRDIFDFPL